MHLFSSLVSVLSFLGFLSPSLSYCASRMFSRTFFPNCRTLTTLLDTLIFSPLLWFSGHSLSPSLGPHLHLSPLSSSPGSSRLVFSFVGRVPSLVGRSLSTSPSRGYRLCLVSLRRSSRGTSMQRDLKLLSLRGLLSAGPFGRELLWLGMQLCSGGSRWDSFLRV